jgi:predicted dehydrogenase
MECPAVTRSISALKRLGRIQVGLLGADESALDDHLAVLRFLPDYELIGIHETSPGSNHTTQSDRFGPTIGSAKELISHPDVDLVAVVGASPLARDHVRDAIAAGKDVFCDWPVLSDARTAYELAVLAERSGISDIIGLFPRVSQTTLYVGDLLAEGYVGNLCSVRLYANLSGAKASLPTSFPNSAQTISPIAELAVHFLDALFSIVGWPRHFSSVVGSRDTPGDATSTAARLRQLCAIGVLEGDGVFSAHFDEWSGPPAVQIDIAGDGGKLKIEAATNYNGENVAIEAFRKGDDRPHLLAIPRSYKWISSQRFPPRTVGLANLYASFARDLHEGTQRAPTIDDAVKMLELLQLIMEA